MAKSSVDLWTDGLSCWLTVCLKVHWSKAYCLVVSCGWSVNLDVWSRLKNSRSLKLDKLSVFSLLVLEMIHQAENWTLGLGLTGGKKRMHILF